MTCKAWSCEARPCDQEWSGRTEVHILKEATPSKNMLWILLRGKEAKIPGDVCESMGLFMRSRTGTLMVLPQQKCLPGCALESGSGTWLDFESCDDWPVGYMPLRQMQGESWLCRVN